jgi:class 3 adenylate cyclase
MSDVTRWLQDLGLAQYARTFGDNDVDLDVLLGRARRQVHGRWRARLFGWPQAHEDEAERAVRAALAILEALARLDTPAGNRPAARIGIATGLAMVGELMGAGAAQEQTVVGETPNLAARLQALAAPGSVVVSHVTRRLLGGLFELADLGPVRLKGFAGPLSAWLTEGLDTADLKDAKALLDELWPPDAVAPA